MEELYKKIYLPDVIGKGYAKFWNFKGRYRVVKGSRASKKSKTTALWFIYNMMKYPEANTLVVRRTGATLKDSCFTELKWSANRLGVDHLWKFKTNPMEAIYLPTGQKIYFRGLDDPLKITSITVDVGVLCWMWVEEAYEIGSEASFDTVDESIRGVVPDGLFKQTTLTFNPWNEKHWMKKRFFDVKDKDVLAMTTNYKCNEWLDDSDKKLFERMKKNNPRRYQVAGLGDWGIVDGLIFENWKESEFDIQEIMKKYPKAETAFGLDFGYTNDPTALCCLLVDQANHKIWVFDEIYKKAMSNRMISDEVKRKGYGKERIIGDSAEPKSIDELKLMGLRVNSAQKGKDSIMNGIQWLQDMEIIIHPKCSNFLTEIGNYTWAKDKLDNQLNKPIDEFNHLMDAMRYATEKYRKSQVKIKSFAGGI